MPDMLYHKGDINCTVDLGRGKRPAGLLHGHDNEVMRALEMLQLCLIAGCHSSIMAKVKLASYSLEQ